MATTTHTTTSVTIDVMGPLQLRVMHHIWKHGPTTVADVHQALNAEPGAAQLAYTTFLTVMRNLVRRSFLHQSRSAARAHLFTPVIDELTYKTAQVSQMRDMLFKGDATAFIAFIHSLA